MNIKDFAKKIDGFEYPANELMKNDLRQEAIDNGFLYAFGMSDDLLELEGIISDEIDAYDGVEIKVGTKGIALESIWSPAEFKGVSWLIKANCEHETFRIMDGGGVYCIGVVIHKDQLNT